MDNLLSIRYEIRKYNSSKDEIYDMFDEDRLHPYMAEPEDEEFFQLNVLEDVSKLTNISTKDIESDLYREYNNKSDKYKEIRIFSARRGNIRDQAHGNAGKNYDCRNHECIAYWIIVYINNVYYGSISVIIPDDYNYIRIRYISKSVASVVAEVLYDKQYPKLNSLLMPYIESIALFYNRKMIYVDPIGKQVEILKKYYEFISTGSKILDEFSPGVDIYRKDITVNKIPIENIEVLLSMDYKTINEIIKVLESNNTVSTMIKESFEKRLLIAKKILQYDMYLGLMFTKALYEMDYGFIRVVMDKMIEENMDIENSLTIEIIKTVESYNYLIEKIKLK